MFQMLPSNTWSSHSGGSTHKLVGAAAWGQESRALVADWVANPLHLGLSARVVVVARGLGYRIKNTFMEFDCGVPQPPELRRRATSEPPSLDRVDFVEEDCDFGRRAPLLARSSGTRAHIECASVPVGRPLSAHCRRWQRDRRQG